MEKEQIHLNDLQRILLGEAPLEFLVEVLVRSVITYIILLVVMKLLGKRMSGRLTNTEMAVMLMLGAVVSSAMQIPERGVLEGSFILLLIILFQRPFTLWTLKKRTLEKAILGTPSLIVKDGMMMPDAMKKELLSNNQFFRKLRARPVYHLGEIKRVYMETNGSFTVIRDKEVIPGLTVLPDEDGDIQRLFEAHDAMACCGHCGKSYPTRELPDTCSNCLHHEWKPAVTYKEIS